MATHAFNPRSFAPGLNLSSKDFIKVSRGLARDVNDREPYGVWSYGMSKKICPTVLIFFPGGEHTVPGNLAKVIVRHAQLMEVDKAVYILPVGTVSTMIDTPLELAKQLADRLGRAIYIHTCAKGALRVGEVRDLEDEFHIKDYYFVAQAQPNPALVFTGTHYREDACDHLDKAARVPKKPRRVKKNEVPKPQNSWVLYLKDSYGQVKLENPGMKTTQISGIVATNWRLAKGTKVEKYYKDLAQKLKEGHAAFYGDYKVKPRKSSEIKRRKTKTVQLDLSPGKANTFKGDIGVPAVQQDNNPSYDFNTQGSSVSDGHSAFVMDNSASHFYRAAEAAFGTAGGNYSGQAVEMNEGYTADASNILPNISNQHLTIATNGESVNFLDDMAGFASADDFDLSQFELPGEDILRIYDFGPGQN
uniref:HMG box protein n=2 Tax=Pyrenopeziza brassicae TaxID=76659 RepID=O93944_PYRBR|nr:HMG box protein [Pyrenopeziza brassicae]